MTVLEFGYLSQVDLLVHASIGSYINQLMSEIFPNFKIVDQSVELKQSEDDTLYARIIHFSCIITNL